MAPPADRPPPFTRLVHADWSVSEKKRWQATARYDRGWTIEAVRPVGDTRRFVAELCATAQHDAVLAGFDFPIGVPNAYGQRTQLHGFRELLDNIGVGRWAQIADIAREPHEISVERPFYPAGAQAGIKQADLLSAHGVETLDALRRGCERSTQDRRAACPLFWTLGGNQVGRGALSGWVEVIKPALAQGARLWPFDGDLDGLGRANGLVLAETYPAEAYGHVGVIFGARESKTRQEDRRSKAAGLFAWAAPNGVTLSPEVAGTIRDGFGSDKAGEDRFDALMGLVGMIEVVSGRRSSGWTPEVGDWEGWILGQGDSLSPRISTPALELSVVEPASLDLHRAVAVWKGEPHAETDGLVSDLLRVWNSVHQGMPIVGPWFEARMISLVRSWIPPGWLVSGPSQIWFDDDPDLRSRSWDIVVHSPPPAGSPPEAWPGAGFPLLPLSCVRAVIDTKTNFSDPQTYARQACFNRSNDCERAQLDALGERVATLVLTATSSRSADALLRDGAAIGLPTYGLARYQASPVADGGEREIVWQMERLSDGRAPLAAFKSTLLESLGS